MVKLLIADDHELMREGVKKIIAMTSDIAVEAEAENGEQVQGFLQRNMFDLILLDMHMPGLSGTDLISWIRLRNRELPILVLTMHNEHQVAMRAIRAGATGYLTKDNDPETLLEAIRKVAGGYPFIDPALAEQVIFKRKDFSVQAPHMQLSERELHIFRLLAQGMSLNQIADELDISNKTVSTHKARLMQKMGFENNADLIRYAILHDLAG
jgi:DNA-binding NarL/FixJ family response regulator